MQELRDVFGPLVKEASLEMILKEVDTDCDGQVIKRDATHDVDFVRRVQGNDASLQPGHGQLLIVAL